MNEEFGKKILNRLSSAEGHIGAIKKMINEGKSCEEVLLQVAAVEAAVRKIGKCILRNHMQTCVAESIKSGDENVLGEFDKLLDKYLLE